MKAVRATLILVPLLGIEFVLIPWRPEGKVAEEVYDYVMHILMHYQVRDSRQSRASLASFVLSLHGGLVFLLAASVTVDYKYRNAF